MNRSTRLFLFLALLLSLAAPTAHAQVDARMLRYPDVSDTHVAFVYAGDIWIVPKDGGVASRLSSPPGEERFPRFSPDGSRIAFSGNYDGNTDLYVMPALGGIPERLTHHPLEDRLLDWTPDGSAVLFASSRESGRQSFRQLYRQPVVGGPPEKLPVAYGEFGALSPDGKTLAYITRSREFRTWKRYRGGLAPDIWLFDLDTYASRNVTDHKANDSHPMWHGATLYFLSDRGPNLRQNLWAYDTRTQETRQVTHFKKFDVHFPAIGPAEIVFEAGGRLYLLDLETEGVRPVKVEVVTDQAALKPRVEQVGGRIQSSDLSPSGRRAVFEARGDLFTVPAQHGIVRNLTRTAGVAERYPAWSPDGQHVAYFSDATGEYELTLRPADGSGQARTLTNLGPGFRYRPFWSPDSKKLAFIDQAMKIHVYDLAADTLLEVDQGLWMYHSHLSRFTVSWSADSRWLAYSRGLDNDHGAIFLYDAEQGTRHQVTSAYYDDRSPVFDPDGKYLYFLSSRTFSPSYSDLQRTWIYANTTKIVAVPLRTDVPSPLTPRNDEEQTSKDKPAEKNEKEKTPEGKKKDKKNAVAIDLDDFERRLVVLPLRAGNYTDLQAASGKVLYRRRPRTGSWNEKHAPAPVFFYDLKARTENVVLRDADRFLVSADGKHLLAQNGWRRAIVKVAPGQRMQRLLHTNKMEMQVDPRAEWRQIFNDVWRFQRDYFYDPALHGVDWKAMRARYGALLEHAATRMDVNYVLGELIGELNASHTYRRGGDLERPKWHGIGLLGVDWELAGGAYRIGRILDGASWDSEVRSPLRRPGLDVEEGDYVLAVNGVPLDPAKDPAAAFEGLAGELVLLTVSDTTTTAGARDVLVKTLTASQEVRLRHLAWIEQNRKRVEEATGGRVGYLYVRDTNVYGQTELVRQFRAQFAKEALIIDERFNGGGQIPDRFIELLNRPVLNYWGVRDGKDWRWPIPAHDGPKAMLINGWSGSGGDAFPYYFRKLGLGPLIGMRTWGGLIGVTGTPSLIDGGYVSVPTFGIYDPEEGWIIEGHGVEPDIEVIDDPAQLARGVDPQLERAIQEVMSRLKEDPPRIVEKPAYPVRAGR